MKMGFLLDAVLESLKMVFVVGFVFAIFNDTFQVSILPLLDTVSYPGITTFKTLVEYVWNNWGVYTIIGAVIYGITAAMRKTDTYAYA